MMLYKNKFFLFLSIVFIPCVSAANLNSATVSEIKTTIIKNGSGLKASKHSKVSVHYTGWLLNGKKFDSSLDRKTPFNFTLGLGQVIRGWDVGVVGMQVGEKRRLIIPPKMGYGNKGAGAVIPANATLRFEITLLKITPPKYKNINNEKLKELIENGTLLVDIRRQDEWQRTGTIGGSKKITAFEKNGRFKQDFPDKFMKLTSRKEAVVLICRAGNRSEVLSQMLTDRANFEVVYNLKDGIERWIKDGNATIK
jgi:rhodanese-related sulfurtransferase